MIEYKTGNIFSEDVEALVNPVNCVGVMGKGLALQFKKLFPDNYRVYSKACKSRYINPGRCFIFNTRKSENPKYIINFPTKRHWKDKSLIEDIENGLEDLTNFVYRIQLKSIALPALGCGLGGLRWTKVKPLIEYYLSPSEKIPIDRKLSLLSDVRIVIFEPT